MRNYPMGFQRTGMTVMSTLVTIARSEPIDVLDEVTTNREREFTVNMRVVLILMLVIQVYAFYSTKERRIACNS